MLKRIYNAIYRLDLSFLGSKLHLQGNGPMEVSYVLPDGNAPQLYPLMLAPQQGTAIIMPQQGKNCKKGPSEQWLALWIWSHRLKGFYDNLTLTSRGHRYEPDFAYIDEQKGIYVDLEVDEPYSGGGKPTHYMNADGTNQDSQRNQNYLNAGWHVVRFSEEQIFCHTEECMKVVYTLLLNVGAIDELPKSLEKVPDLEAVPRWTYAESNELKRKGFRKSYLGFDPAKMDIQGYYKCLKLFMPIFRHSLTNIKLRKASTKELLSFFVNRR